MPSLCEDTNSDDHHESNTKESFEICTEIQSHHHEDHETEFIPAIKKHRIDENVDVFSPRLPNLSSSLDSEFLAQNMLLFPEADHISFHWNIINNIEAWPSVAVPSFL